MKRCHGLLVVLVITSLVGACGDTGGTSTTDATVADAADTAVADAADTSVADADDATAADTADTSVAAVPITAPAKTWTWVDIAGAYCDDGSGTGIGVNLNPDSDNLIVYMEGGGACWSSVTCLVLNSATHGPFQSTQFATAKTRLYGYFDRADGDNPFAEWNYVYIPYCTGDLHGGNNVTSYLDTNGAAVEYHHVGHRNVLEALARLRATLPTVDRFMLTGASAGGYGVLFNYDSFRSTLTPSESGFIDDSGPPLIGDAVDPSIRDAWLAAWRPQASIEAVCGDACYADLSLTMTKLAQRYPDDRMSLLSSLQDQTIRSYLGLTPQQFEADLRALVTTRIAPESNVRAYLVAGSSHTMLGSVSDFAGLADFVAAQLSGTGWTSVIPQ